VYQAGGKSVTETNFYAAIQLQQTDSLTLKLILKKKFTDTCSAKIQSGFNQDDLCGC
jgi:hypothetical protein